MSLPPSDSSQTTATPSSQAGGGARAPVKIEFADPHLAVADLQEAEVTRIRALQGFWRWALIVLTAVTILLCINQQFSLRFFIDYTQLNTEYFYLLIALMLPFTYLIFPGTATAPLDRIPWYDVALFVLTFGAAIWLMMNVRKAAAAGWEFGGAPTTVIIAGLVMWVALMEALRRTGGWSLLLSVFPFTVYPLFADAKWLGPFRGTQSNLEQTTAYHMLSGESLLGIPIQAFADTVIGFLVFGTALMMTGAGKFFINIAFAMCGTFRGGAAKVCVFASGLLGTVGGSIVSNVLTAGTMTIPAMKKTGFTPSYSAAIEACASTGAVLAPPVLGATAFVMAQFMNTGYADVALAATIPSVLYYVGLFAQVDAYAARHKLKGLPRAELPRFMDAFKEGWYYLFVIAILVVMLLYFKRESHAPFYASVLLVILHQWSGPAPWNAADRGSGAVNRRNLRDALVRRAQRVSLGHVPARRDERILPGQELGRRALAAFPRTQRQDVRRADRYSRRMRPADRRVFPDRRDLKPRQRSPQHCRRRCIPAADHVRDHQPDPGPRTDDYVLLYLPRHSGRAGAGKGRPQQDGRAHVHLLLGHAVGDHAPGRHRLLRRGRNSQARPR